MTSNNKIDSTGKLPTTSSIIVFDMTALNPVEPIKELNFLKVTNFNSDHNMENFFI